MFPLNIMNLPWQASIAGLVAHGNTAVTSRLFSHANGNRSPSYTAHRDVALGNRTTEAFTATKNTKKKAMECNHSRSSRVLSSSLPSRAFWRREKARTRKSLRTEDVRPSRPTPWERVRSRLRKRSRRRRRYVIRVSHAVNAARRHPQYVPPPTRARAFACARCLFFCAAARGVGTWGGGGG